VPPPPQNLHSERGTFNIDPGAPYLASGGIDDVPEPVPPAGKSARNFVGGFAIGLRKMMQRNHGTGGIGMSPPPSAAYGFQAPGPEYDPEYGAVNTGTSFSARGSSVATSETLHAPLQTDDMHDGETTAIHHDILPTGEYVGSPVSADPQPGSDYAKMDSPTPPASDRSFGSYMNRVRTFFRELNDLPWVAERVTVDYIPGQSKRRARPRPTHRPIISWYNPNVNPISAGTVDLLSGSSPSASPSVQHVRPSINGQSVYTESVYGNAQSPPLMTSVTHEATTIPRSMGGAAAVAPPRSTYVPTEFSPVSATSPSGQWPTRYPHGYAPYQPQAGYGDAIHANTAVGQSATPAYVQPHSAPLRWGPLNTSE